jgi:chromosome segregation ATPase
MRNHETEGPRKFDVVFRGYARGPVDEYVTRLHEWLVDCEARAENAMQNATAVVGDRVSEILQTAFDAAEQARQSTEKEAAKALEQAEQRAAEVLRFAERRADQLRERADATLKEAEKTKEEAIANARAEAERSLDEARHQQDAIRQSIKELADRKANALRELTRLQTYLAGAPEARSVEPVEARPDIEPPSTEINASATQAAPAAS